MTPPERGAEAARPPEASEPDLLDSPEAGQAALRGSALRTVAYVLGILMSLISAPLLVRHLGVARFGQYTIVVSLVTIVAGFTEGGLNSIVLREFATLEPARRGEMMGSAIGIRVVLTAAGVLVALAFGAVVGYSSTLIIGIALAGVALVFQLLQSLMAVTLQAQLRFGWVSIAELVRQGVNVALLVGLVLAGAGLLPLIAVAIPASVVSLLFTVPLVRAHMSFVPNFHFGRWWRLLRESVPWAIIAAVNIVYFRISIVLMSIVASELQTGYFSTSFRITEVLVGIPGIVIGAAFPILARAQRDDARRFDLASARIFELALIAGAGMVVCLEIVAPFAIHVLADHKAEPAIGVLRIQVVALLANFVGVACGISLLTLRRYREVLIANIGALVLAAILTLAMAPSLGARGAAIAAVVSECGLAISQAVLLTRASPGISLRLDHMALVGVAAGVAVASGLLLPVHPLIGAAVGGLVYVVALRLVGCFPPEARELLAGRLRTTLGA
jgi:O-antigen/teichoic acid export membrane protein